LAADPGRAASIIVPRRRRPPFSFAARLTRAARRRSTSRQLIHLRRNAAAPRQGSHTIARKNRLGGKHADRSTHQTGATVEQDGRDDRRLLDDDTVDLEAFDDFDAGELDPDDGDGLDAGDARSTASPIEHALLVALDLPDRTWLVQDSLEELARLAESAGVEVVGSVTQKLPHPQSGTYLGKGKLQEVKALRDSLGYDVVIFDEELTPAQQRGLEKALEVKILDRTALILDVFARRAQTHEGRLQVELAQLQYRLPRLTRMWTHLSRQTVRGAAGVGLRGPGETQLEVDRRESRIRITQLKRELGRVHTHRQHYRDARRNTPVPVAALVGYTNAGKSTLLNSLTGAGVLAEDKLFATLDPTTRRVRMPSGREVLLTDTVGFINHLPTLLIAAFRATLEEINEATVLVHVLDVTHANAAEQAKTVATVLEELGADDKPQVLALNKVDALPTPAAPETLASDLGLDPADFAAVVTISGLHGTGLADLLAAVERTVESDTGFVPVRLAVPFDRGDLVARFHRFGRVEETAFDELGTTIRGALPASLIGRFAPYIQELPRPLEEGATRPSTPAPVGAVAVPHPAA
jgi:GTP-binding protein HflX